MCSLIANGSVVDAARMQASERNGEANVRLDLPNKFASVGHKAAGRPKTDAGGGGGGGGGGEAKKEHRPSKFTGDY